MDATKTNSPTSLTKESILEALNKVGHIHDTELCHLCDFVATNPEHAIEAFTQMTSLESIDDRFKFIVDNYPELQSDAECLLETAILLD